MNAPDPTQTFLLEADDLLTQIEETALDLEQHPNDVEALNRMFRAFHTLKGSGAMFGFDAVAGFTHHVETVLDQVRSGRRTMDTTLPKMLLAARDHIQRLLKEPTAPDLPAQGRDLAEQFIALAGDGVIAPTAAAAATVGAAAATSLTWRISFRPAKNVGATGLNPVSLLDDLRSLGACRVEADLKAIPPVDQLQPEDCLIGWRIALTTDRGLNAIQDVFIFVQDESQLTIEPEAPAAAAAPAVSPATASSPTATRSTAVSPAAPARPAAAEPRKPSTDTTVRVPSAKLDRLVNLVGEFVMNQSRLAQVSARRDDADLAICAEAIERLVTELRDSVLGIRMMPIGSTFSRFKRLVRDLAQELGKEIDLVTEGAETELDKTVLDQLGDPLVHLIRNCADHGIGRPDERERSGKPRRGTIRLSASHAGSHVVIAIHDDGRGLDVAAIRAKAIEQKLIAADANIPEAEIFNLIFLPGFSTAKQVTSVSGRGVGMDVVRKQIDALRGGIQLESKPGVGTTVRLTLPLTLAIIEGLLVEIAGDQFIVPMSAVLENVELHREDRARQNGRNLVTVRGDLIPYLRLREMFAMPGDGPDIEKVVVARHGEQRVGLVVDRVLGSHQTVIQSLGRFYRHVEVCSGSTIMGDGRVALILDLPGLVRHAERGVTPAA